MSLVARLQQRAEEQGTNFKQIEKACGIGNGTIRRWDDNNPRFDIIKKVADYLQVSLDFLSGNSDSVRPRPRDSSGTPLSDDEDDLIFMYRELDELEKDMAFGILTNVYESSLKKRGSSPSENTGTGA